MGSCFSKKSSCVSSSSSSSKPTEKIKPHVLFERSKPEEETVKKEIFVIKHRKSHDLLPNEEGKRDSKRLEEVGGHCRNVASNCASGNGTDVTGGGVAAVRTSSSTKEELDAILIQCGRLSRSSSTGKAAALRESGGKKYSGSKRSYDFDDESNGIDNSAGDQDECDGVVGRGSENRHRQPNRQSSGRRRKPSREREREQLRSTSKERNGRRVSRSPGRRSESPITSGVTNSSAAVSASRPGKMVSVPATVPLSTPVDKDSNASGSGSDEANSSLVIKRIQVKRNACGDANAGSRTASSPRSRSPARIKASNENQTVNPGQIQSLSRSNSRKAEISPYRRAPLNEIDTNIILQTPSRKQKVEPSQTTQWASENKLNSKMKEEIQVLEEEIKGTLNVVSSGTENLKPQRAVRSRSSRLSKELDINPETLLNPTASYTSLLLEDIQNFHQKNWAPAYSLPPCLTKACSILEAVADLNSSTGSNLSSTFSQDRLRNAITEQFSNNNDNKPASGVGKMKSNTREPLVESEVVVYDDLMDPTFHKYVTVGRGTTGLEDLEEQESSGSNSFVGIQENWISSSSWDPNSVDSTDRWESSRTARRQNEVNPVGFQRHATPDSGRGSTDSGKVAGAKKRDLANHQTGIGRGMIGFKGPQKVPATAT